MGITFLKIFRQRFQICKIFKECDCRKYLNALKRKLPPQEEMQLRVLITPGCFSFRKRNLSTEIASLSRTPSLTPMMISLLTNRRKNPFYSCGNKVEWATHWCSLTFSQEQYWCKDTRSTVQVCSPPTSRSFPLCVSRGFHHRPIPALRTEWNRDLCVSPT